MNYRILPDNDHIFIISLELEQPLQRSVGRQFIKLSNVIQCSVRLNCKDLIHSVLRVVVDAFCLVEGYNKELMTYVGMSGDAW